MTRYRLSRASRERLTGVHVDLVLITGRAIQLTGVDFAVFEGLRTETRQRRLVEQGASWTMDSRHITGHAVDLVPYVDGELRWDWPLCYRIAEAVRAAGREMGVPIRWGGCWDMQLTATGDTPTDELVSDYVLRRQQAGRPARIDGPHFELPSETYPA